MTAGWLVSTAAGAQGVAPAAGVELTPAERAQRDADKVFKWILIHADKPRKPGAAREEKRDERREEKPLAAARVKPAARAAESAASPSVAAATTAPAPIAAAPETPPVVDASPAPAVATAPLAATEPPVAPTSVVDARVALPRAEPAPAPAELAAEVIEETLTPLFRAEPQFPGSVLRTLRKGAVQLRFTVMPDGSVADAAVVTSTNARLNPSALAAIAQWRFAPLRRPQAGLVALGFDLD